MTPNRLTDNNGNTPVPPSLTGGRAPYAVVELPVPGGLLARESQALSPRSSHPEGVIVVRYDGYNLVMSPSQAELFADQLVSCAARIRRLARQASRSGASRPAPCGTQSMTQDPPSS